MHERVLLTVGVAMDAQVGQHSQERVTVASPGLTDSGTAPAPPLVCLGGPGPNQATPGPEVAHQPKPSPPQHQPNNPVIK
jgi:hypothetical protein